MRIHFKVRNDIVFGLKFVNNVYKLLAKGNRIAIQSTRTRTKWAASLPKTRLTLSICRGSKPLRASSPVETIKAKLW
jgi:hypothetical protein